jgi:hypothetical protein
VDLASAVPPQLTTIFAMTGSKLALDPPQEDLALITRALLDEAVLKSRRSPRRRIITPLHCSLSDPLHRMLNAIQPGSYVRPHRHLDPPKAEAWIVLRGAVLFVTFLDDGTVSNISCSILNRKSLGSIWCRDSITLWLLSSRTRSSTR